MQDTKQAHQIKHHVFKGVNVLKSHICFPTFENDTLDTEFENYAIEINSFVCDILFPRVCDEYEKSADPKKRFRFGYFYEFNAKELYRSDIFSSVQISSSLHKKGSRVSILSLNRFIVFRRSDGIIMPIEAFADKKTIKEYRKNGYGSFFLLDDELRFINNKDM